MSSNVEDICVIQMIKKSQDLSSVTEGSTDSVSQTD